MTSENQSLSFTEKEIVEGYKPHAVSDGGVGGPKRKDVSDERLNGSRDRKERVERAAANGNGGSQGGAGLSLDEVTMLLRYLPKGFLSGYMKLIDCGAGEGRLGSGRGYDENDLGYGARSKVGTSSNSPLYRGGAVQKGKSTANSSNGMIANDKAIEYRGRLDRRLRHEGRKIEAFLTQKSSVTDVVVSRQCTGKCRKFGDAEWLFCPRCGGPMQDCM